jgi:hypothetical protein
MAKKKLNSMSQNIKTFRRRFYLLFPGCYQLFIFCSKSAKGITPDSKTFGENFNIEFGF